MKNIKKRLAILALALVVGGGTFGANSVTCYASGLTYEGLREWLLQNGAVRGGGGTHDEVSVCPGQDVPNNSQSSSETPTTPNTVTTPETPKEPPKPVHTHSYLETVTKEPTCIEEGVKTFTCSCGDKYTEPIEVIEHDYSKRITEKEPTCSEKGKVLVSCSVCNDTYEEETEPLGHEEGSWVTTQAPTCFESGINVRYCSRCDEALEEKAVEATGHDDGSWVIVKRDTLFTKGEAQLQCTACHEVLDTEVIPIDTHTWFKIIGVIVCVVLWTITFIVIGKNRKKKKAAK